MTRGPSVTEVWVPEEELELWEIKSFGEKVEKQQQAINDKIAQQSAQQIEAQMEAQLKLQRQAIQQKRLLEQAKSITTSVTTVITATTTTAATTTVAKVLTPGASPRRRRCRSALRPCSALLPAQRRFAGGESRHARKAADRRHDPTEDDTLRAEVRDHYGRVKQRGDGEARRGHRQVRRSATGRNCRAVA